jgi:hypothetical protein
VSGSKQLPQSYPLRLPVEQGIQGLQQLIDVFDQPISLGDCLNCKHLLVCSTMSLNESVQMTAQTSCKTITQALHYAIPICAEGCHALLHVKTQQLTRVDNAS